MRKALAAVLSASIALLAPGQSLSYAAQVAAPKVGSVGSSVGGSGAAGASLKLQATPGLSLPTGGLALPTGITPNLAVPNLNLPQSVIAPNVSAAPAQFAAPQQAVQAAASASPNALTTPNTPSAQALPTGRMPTRGGTFGRAGSIINGNKAANEPGAPAAPAKALLTALSLPSLIQPGAAPSAASAKALAEGDFNLRMGGGAQNSRGEVNASQSGRFAGPENAAFNATAVSAQGPLQNPYQSRSAQERGLNPAAAQTLSAVSNTPGLRAGTLTLNNPDQAASNLIIRSPIPGDQAVSAAARASLSSPYPSAANNAAAASAKAGLGLPVAQALIAATQKVGEALSPVILGGTVERAMQFAKQNDASELDAAAADYAADGAVFAGNTDQGLTADETAAKKASALSKISYSSVYFPLALLGTAAAVLALSIGLPWLWNQFLPMVMPQTAVETVTSIPGAGIVATAFSAAFWSASFITLAALAFTLWEITLFYVGIATKKPVTDQEFWTFLHKELNSWDLHPSVRTSLLGTGPGRGMLKVYRPAHKWSRLAFAFTTAGAVYIRPELIRTPWLFRLVLRHEFTHLRANLKRGPPLAIGRIRSILNFVGSEVGARVSQFRTGKVLAEMRIPVLSRVLNEAKFSLRLGRSYNVLLINPGSHETRNPSIYKDQSADEAKLQFVPEGESLPGYLGRSENQKRFRLVVYPQAFNALPNREAPDGRKLRMALDRLNQLYVLARRLPYLEVGSARRTPEIAQLQELASRAGVRWQSKMSAEQIEKMIEDMFYRIARQSLTGFGFVDQLSGIYESLHHKGAVMMPFAAEEPGLEIIERTMRYWQSEDGGGFSVQRIDLPEGGHILVARKAEPRVDLWLRPSEGNAIDKSMTNIAAQVDGGPSQEGILRAAGFTDEDLARFNQADLEVRHVFGKDVGDNRIYVNVKKSRAKILRRYAEESGIQFQSSRSDFELHLMKTGEMAHAPQTWKLRISGEGGRIYDIDTGLDTTHPDFADRMMESVDFVDEGPEDWIGHGTHKGGISYANGSVYRGIAPKAMGRMGKVFAQSGQGASDGDIMAAAVDAMQWGADVISLSLGSPGTVDAALSEFFSNLTRQKNAKGHFPIVTGSAGNSGPFNQSKSQPSVGRRVASVAAANKEGVVSFFSSVGPVEDKRWSRRRWRMPLGGTAVGGDVTTPPDMMERPPNKRDVYEFGVEAPKAKDMAPSPSDTADGKHTRMSGTSMSNPVYAGVALLVKQAILRAAKAGTEAHQFFMDELPDAVNLVIARSAEDMRVPIHFQEPGFINAEAAVHLGAQSFGGQLLSWTQRAWSLLTGWLKLFAPSQAGQEKPWAWITRVKHIWALEDRVYEEAEAVKTARLAELQAEASANKPSGPIDAPEESEQRHRAEKQIIGDQAQAAFEARFSEVTAEVLGELKAALSYKDGNPAEPVWLVRMYAAWALMNLRTPEAALTLAEAALNDADGRVRQTAFLALAETASYSADIALRQALSDTRADVRMYAAYALARHGDASGVDRIIAEAKTPDERIRHTAAWLLGQLGRRAPPEASDALASRVVDAKEDGNIRHLAVSSLTEISAAMPSAVTAETILQLLNTAGVQNFALTRTISKFFREAARSAEIRQRMREQPLKDDILAFIHKNKNSVLRPGALGDMVRILAKVLNVPLDQPTPLPNPEGVGVPGVDPSMGPVHLLVELPTGAQKAPVIQAFRDFRTAEGQAARLSALSSFGLDMEIVESNEAQLQAALPTRQTLWFNVPDHKVTAFRTEMEAKGYVVRRAAPMYRLTHETGPGTGALPLRQATGLSGKGVTVAYLDEGGATQHPGIAQNRIAGARNFSGDGRPDQVDKESVSHGTHGMGIVGADAFKGAQGASPYVGMAPGVTFLIGKVLGETGGSEATVMAGMEWAASQVADPLKTPLIINMSLGGPGSPDSPLGRLANALRLKNIAIVAAAGNSGPMEGTVSSPANAPLVTAIGAVDKAGNLTEYSSRSPKGEREISRVNTGGAVFMDRPNLYEIVSALNPKLSEDMKGQPTAVEFEGKVLFHTMSGTSMAAPHETGHKALLIEKMLAAFGRLPDGYDLWLDRIMDKTAKAMKEAANEVGAGLTDVQAALAALTKALEDPQRVAREAAELKADAHKKYGDPGAAPVETKGMFQRLSAGVPHTVKAILLFTMGLGLLP